MTAASDYLLSTSYYPALSSQSTSYPMRMYHLVTASP